MPIAADYPFLDVLWSMIIFFVWVIWIWMMILILTTSSAGMISRVGARRAGRPS